MYNENISSYFVAVYPSFEGEQKLNKKKVKIIAIINSI
jgi:hypothetical protein